MEHTNIEKIRHSLAHIMASAIKQKFPEMKFGIGPIIENGFYYDFDDVEIKDTDLAKIQKEMKKLIQKNIVFEKEEISTNDAKKMFKDQPYKIELIEDLIKNEGVKNVTIYLSDGFVDLCAGPHIESTKEINSDAFKLTKVAGAYWRGDEKNKMLTRVYGVAFETKEELEEYEKRQEEAEKRDHRKLGKELDLFTFSDLIGPGLPLFTPKGTLIRDLIIDKIQNIQKDYGYQRVDIPHITKSDLYKTSGHWEKFGDELFKVKGQGDSEFVMKPMNCPHHTQIYASKQVSYKNLPIRYTESTKVYRDEQAGELIGLSRVRSITQDDGHIFCAPDQIEQEVANIVSIIKEFYESLNMFNVGDYWVSLSVRDSKDLSKYLGDENLWDKAEKTLEEIAKKENLPYKKVEGEAAFYGPKLDFMFKDALGRERQLATAQLDFIMPQRFKLEYTDKDGTKKTPVMIHRAIAGSLERFMAVMIEHFAGAFPFWLSPVQVKVLPIADAHKEYAKNIYDQIKAKGFRVELDDDNESLGKKIRKAKMEKIPYLLVIGEKEVEEKTITVESRDNGNIGAMNLDDLIQKFSNENK
ncbi:threonine--tRNA ligase [Candidatus Campbellbacteria bacterium RIFCSPLOWO2_02_FULL_35_11]|uniref:Threonine--tRNA ligase n=2 Tax=Candidatus Campbelliibacteriota TaxID=1752727 RepID=A0A1F5ENY6_9BACT|nr:MAG: threonine--tRNA ligase [Candidatus Campbellbacteria bacterium RIFCSPHIGHO2_12_FULL_35_10]OGD70405.1 MAG: threonine--tRNA ligase [Candidatus Campbellbacteria bacterium RIFCSPLOWO2_02_FULL_35_11]